LERGQGICVDLTKAIHWLTQAANQGEVNSMMALGTVLLEDAESRLGDLGITGDSPLPLAINWMRRGGKLGMNNLNYVRMPLLNI